MASSTARIQRGGGVVIQINRKFDGWGGMSVAAHLEMILLEL